MLDVTIAMNFPTMKGKGTPPCATADPESFFPNAGEREPTPGVARLSASSHEVKLAKKICSGCQYVEECLNFALDTNEVYGIWGGLTYRERAALKRRRGRVTPPKPRTRTK